MKIKTQFKTMTTPLLNIETAIANIEETLEALTVPYSAALHLNDNLNTLRQSLMALEYIQSSQADHKVNDGSPELTEQEKQIGTLYPYLKRKQHITLSLQEALIYEYLQERLLENKATFEQRLLLQHIVSGNHLEFTDTDKFTAVELHMTVNRLTSENSKLLSALYVMQA
jgi:hypothetical protein